MDQVTHDNLEAFLSQKGEKPKIIVIYGPTACGKTSLSIEIAKRLETEIISVDARQVYKHLNIGTGKVTPEEMQGIVHHMLDIIELDRVYSVVDFQREAEEHMRNILAKGKIPILCGGTGLYIDSLVFERSYSESTIDWDLRDELEAYRLTHGNEALWKKLHAIDPSYAETLHINNYRYVIRGIEVFTKTGISKGAIKDSPTLKYDTLFLTPYDGNRDALYEKINARVEEMFRTGLVEEVEYIVRTLFWGDIQNAFSCPGLATIGYREVIEFLMGKHSLEDTKALVSQHNRNYAKRQITWNKKYGELRQGNFYSRET